MVPQHGVSLSPKIMAIPQFLGEDSPFATPRPPKKYSPSVFMGHQYWGGGGEMEAKLFEEQQLRFPQAEWQQEVKRQPQKTSLFVPFLSHFSLFKKKSPKAANK